MGQENSNGAIDALLDSFDVSKKKMIQYGFNILSVLGFLFSLYIVYLGFRTEIFTSAEALANFLDYIGPIAPYVFVLIQILQSIVPIIPSTITIH